MEEDTTYLTNVASFIFSWHTQVTVCSFLIYKERLWMSMCYVYVVMSGTGRPDGIDIDA